MKKTNKPIRPSRRSDIPWSDRFWNFIIRSASLFVLFSFLVLISGCSYYRYTPKNNQPPDQFLKKLTMAVYPGIYSGGDTEYYMTWAEKIFSGKMIVLMGGEGKWLLVNPKISGDTIVAEARFIPFPEDPRDVPELRKSKSYDPKTESYIINSIFLFSGSAEPEHGEMIYIPFSGIDHFRVYEKNAAKGIGLFIGVVVLTGTALFFIIGLINFSQWDPLDY